MGWKLAAVVARLEARNFQTFVNDVYGAPQQLEASNDIVETAIPSSLDKQRFALEHRGVGWVFDGDPVDRSFKAPLSAGFLLWTFYLDSFDNWYGFTVQENGARVRSRYGGHADGIVVDVGTTSELERQLVKACAKPGSEERALEAWADASKTFPGPDSEHTHDVIGESVVFGLIQGITGFRIDMDSPEASSFLNARVLKVLPRKL
jgi:hypothetical protein